MSRPRYGSGALANFDNGKVLGINAGTAFVSGYVSGNTDSTFFGAGGEKTTSASVATLSQIQDSNGQLVGREYGAGLKASLPGANSVEVSTFTRPLLSVDTGSFGKSIATAGQKALQGLDAVFGQTPISNQNNNSDRQSGTPSSFDPSNIPNSSPLNSSDSFGTTGGNSGP